MAATTRVWVVDDDESIRWVLEKSLSRAGLEVRAFVGAAELFDAFEGEVPDVLISDIRMPGVDGLEVLERIGRDRPGLPVIITTAHSDLDAAVASFRGGAFEYLPKPFDVDAAVALVRRAARRAKPGSDQPRSASGGTAIIGEAPAMQEVFRAIGRLAQSNISVLITGETGVGKELVARALHEHSPRAARPFIAVNTAAIPKELMESEFFGHERGAFTGAQAQRKGRFEQAHGGTLFLDEIGDMPADLQTRLLRVLADGEFYRVGGTTPIQVDVRVLAATHQELDRAVAEGRFREDLFHRLNVIRVRVPPLRERREDIPALLEFFLGRAARELKVEPKRLGKDVMAQLQSLPWSGNVRQVENACRWLCVMAPGRDIQLGDLPDDLRPGAIPATPESAQGGTRSSAPATGENGDWAAQLGAWASQRLRAGDQDLLGVALPEFERTLIRIALAECRGQRQDAAKRLGWGRNTLTRKIKDLGLDDL